MPQISFTVDVATKNALEDKAKKAGASLSHYINKIVQAALVSDAIISDSEPSLKQSKQLLFNKKLLSFCNENLALTRYLVTHFGDEEHQQSNAEILKKAHDHAVSYAAGLLEK